jgi:hypothetical protein
MSQAINSAVSAHANAESARVENAGPAAHLPNPAATLEAARGRFPGVSDSVLTGRGVLTERTANVLDAAATARARPLAGTVAVLLGSAENSGVALMPTAGVKGPDKAAKIQAYVTEGAAIYKQIAGGEYAGRPDKHEVAKLMWYMQALASSKASASSAGTGPALYKDGAMFVEDPQGRLEQFLLSANSYSRSSSHMNDYQSLGSRYKPHGVDLRKVETPNERGTILFQRLPTNQEAAAGMRGTGDRRMLFFKMEEHGCRGITPRGSGTPREHETPGSVWKGVKRFFLNIKDFCGHATGFLKSVSRRSGLSAIDGQNNRERIPSDVKNAFERLRADIINLPLRDEADAGIQRALLAALDQGKPLSNSGGIKQMLPNLEAARKVEVSGTNREAWAALRGKIDAALAMFKAHGDHSDARIGNEVILTRDEMDIQALKPVALYKAGETAEGRGVLPERSVEIMLAGYQYLADNVDNEESDRTFDVDAARMPYNIGFQGQEETIDRDAQSASARLRELTGGNERLEKVIRRICNQGLAAYMVSLASADATAAHGIFASPGSNAGSLGISRHPDSVNGEITFTLKHESEKPSDLPLPFMDARPDGMSFLNLDAERSFLRLRTSINLTLATDGRIRVSSGPEPCSYSYRLVPGAAAEPNVAEDAHEPTV